jgi:hypothetical protein
VPHEPRRAKLLRRFSLLIQFVRFSFRLVRINENFAEFGLHFVSGASMQDVLLRDPALPHGTVGCFEPDYLSDHEPDDLPEPSHSGECALQAVCPRQEADRISPVEMKFLDR